MSRKYKYIYEDSHSKVYYFGILSQDTFTGGSKKEFCYRCCYIHMYM